MTIEGLNSVTSYQPITATQMREGLSKTDWKTHSLVALSYLLIGIGFTLACCTVYIAVAVHPMIAMASPAVPIALGILGLQYTSNPKMIGDAHSSNMGQAAPGIENAGANCWINSSLELLFHVPAFKKVMQNLAASSESVLGRVQLALMPNSGVGPIVDAYKDYKQDALDKKAISSVDSQKIREWLHRQGIKIDPNASVPDDPTQFFFQPILKKIGHHLPTETGKEIDRKGGQVVSVNTINGFSYYFDLSPSIVAGKTSLQEAFNYHFKHDEQLPSGTDREYIRILKTAPEDISITNPSGSEAGKVVTKLHDAMQFSLSAGQVGEDAQYYCDGFISHLGPSIHKGHYTACYLEDGAWWEANDRAVHKISLKEANNKLSTASFMHYQKVPLAITENVAGG